MKTLEQVLSDFRPPFAILAGAGVSIDSPAGLPSARSLMERSLLHQISGIVAREDLAHIIDRPTDFPARPGEFLRFEVAMADIERHVRASLLSELQSGTPNINHYALAQLVKRGAVVITTNFDLHIETAYKHLYGRDCRVARHDKDFTAPPSPRRNSAGVLWKIHGCLTDVESMAATFTTIFSKRSRRMDWFEEILSNYDLIVVGYSGSDDLDLIPPLARTITERSLLWVDHKEKGAAEWITPQQWLARGSAQMHLDCVGLTRVLFSCHSLPKPTRRDGAAMVLAGHTRTILDEVLRRAGLTPLIPDGPPPIVEGAKHENAGGLDEFDSANNVLRLLQFRRGPTVKAIVQRATEQLVSAGIRQPPSRQLELLVQLYNLKSARAALGAIVDNDTQAWGGIANNDRDAFLAKLKEILPKLTAPDMPQALRLLACLCHERDPYDARRCFEMSIIAAREIGDSVAEMSTLSTYSNILYPSYFPMFWLDEKPFPHAGRMEELVGSTGFVPMVGQGNLLRDTDYANKLQVFHPSYVQEHAAIEFYNVFQDATESRRMSIDMGDVLGEMQATYVIALLTLVSAMYFKKVPLFNAWTETQRLDILAEALGQPKNFGERLAYVMTLPAPEGEATREELKSSMFP